jgi:pilus assembly protein CpaE
VTVIAGLALTNDEELEALIRGSGAKVLPVDLAKPEGLGADKLDVLVVDLRMRESLPEDLASFRSKHPQVGVIIVTSALDPTLMLEALRAGVNECVTEPLKQDELAAAIDRLMGQRSDSSQPGDVFAFLGAKGGVGTTTVAVNFAAALAQEAPGNTLLIDLHHAYGDAGVFLGVESRFSVLDALENTHRLDKSFLQSLVVQTASRLDLLASGDRPISAGVDSQRVHALLEQCAKLYRFVVVDVSRSDSAGLEALSVAKSIVVVANQELATVRNASRMAERLRKRYGKDRVTIAISRSDDHSEIGHDDVEKAVGTSVRYTFPSDYKLALQAMNKGRPLMLDNHSSLASSFRKFAEDLADLESGGTDEAVSSGLFSRLAGRRN